VQHNVAPRFTDPGDYGRLTGALACVHGTILVIINWCRDNVSATGKKQQLTKYYW